ncbi:hypothetical protein [Kribbella sp. NPDC004875]|uniref:MmyB family transcriptional regulator n=1 Tax=Kribbella sp. NPDC004875 TaxID=3364107 RepID=UPI003675D3E9
MRQIDLAGASDDVRDQVGDLADRDGREGAPQVVDHRPRSREFYADWPTVAKDSVALLRQASAAYADDAELVALVNELRAASPAFDEFWTSQDVQNRAPHQASTR